MDKWIAWLRVSWRRLKRVGWGRLSKNVSSEMITAGYAAIEQLLPFELRPPNGPLTVDQLKSMAEACYRAMVARAAQATESK